MLRASVHRLSVLCSILLTLAAPPLRADEIDGPVPSANRPAVPDASLRAVAGREVALRLREGGERSGRLLAFEADTVTIAAANGEVVSLPRADVIGLRLPSVPAPVLAPAVVAALAAPPPEPSRHRHLGISLGIPPGVDIDLDYSLFHGFLAASLVFPLASNGNWYGFSLGLGLGIPVARSLPNFRFDVFAHLNVMVEDSGGCFNCSGGTTQVTIGFGGGIGFHYTWNNGLTLGFTTPILGYSVTTGKSNSSTGEGAANYYLSSAVTMPLGFIGYRF
jgi:hypothetical protein